MTATFRLTRNLLKKVKKDLARAHPIAAERVGFISCRAVRTVDGDMILLGDAYHPVADDKYIEDSRVGAAIGSAAIRAAMQVAYSRKCGMFFVHQHEHKGPPDFGPTDRKTNARLLPDFFNVVPDMPHGAIVFSHDMAAGIYLPSKTGRPNHLTNVVVVGGPFSFFWRER